MKHQLDATLCRFYFCRVTLHVSGASAHHQEYLKLVQRPLVHVAGQSVPALIRRCDDWPATITHVPVAAVLDLNTPEDGRLCTEHVEWPCRNKTCTVLHQVGVSFVLYYDARKHKIKTWVDFTQLVEKHSPKKSAKNLQVCVTVIQDVCCKIKKKVQYIF